MENRGKLRSNGLYYPEYGQDYLWGHHNLISYFSSPDDSKNTSALRANLLKDELDVIISSEDYSQLPKDALVNIKRIFNDCEIVIIAYLRLGSRRIFSLWQELVKAGKTLPLPEYLINSIMTAERNPIFNPLVYLDNFISVYGRESLKLICYDNLVHNKIDIFKYLFDSVLSEYKDDYSSENTTINPSLPLHLVETIRLLNHIHHNNGHDASILIRNNFLKYIAGQQGKATSAKLHDYFNGNKSSLDITPLNYLFTGNDKHTYDALVGTVYNSSLDSIYYPEVLKQTVVIDYYRMDNVLFNNEIIDLLHAIYDDIKN